MENSQNSLIENSVLGSKWFNPDFWFNEGTTFLQKLFGVSVTVDVFSIIKNILFFFSLFFLTLIAYCAIRLLEIRKKEHAHLKHELEEYAHHQAEKEKKKQEGEGVSKNERWLKTLAYLFSEHPSDWKLAVIEADSMLEGLLEGLGFKGANLGEKLKGATQESFRGLSRAWEVHTIRNRIAHEGGAYELSHHEAKRVIAIYEEMFREFGYI